MVCSNWQPPKTYRTAAEADALMPRARAIMLEVKRRVSADQIAIGEGTLFVGREIPERAAVFAASLVGIPYQVAPIEFGLDEEPFEETVQGIVEGLLRWRESVVNAQSDESAAAE
jgi:hypothetical protein